MKSSRQIIQERHQNILSMIRENGEVRVEELAKTFSISEITVRRDLQVLEEQNLICRTHGGAISLANLERISDFNTQISLCRQAISSYAARYIEDGDTLFINGSITALGMLSNVENKRIDVYTNNGRAIGMKVSPGVKIHLTGGELRGHIMVGDYVMKNLLEIQADKTFIGCAAVYDDGEFRYDIPTEIGINEAMIARTNKELYVLADHAKLQRRAGQIQSYGTIIYDRPYTLITDGMADKEILDTLKSQKVNVIKVPLE